MEVLRLGVPYDTTYLPDRLIEGYTSMIWTERFQEPGDFELRTNMIDETLQTLPEMTFITHLETDVVMMVENHEINVDEDGSKELVVTGHSLDAFLKHRHVQGAYGRRRRMPKYLKPRGAAMALIWNAIDNGSPYDVTRPNRRAVPERDKITNVMVTDSTPLEMIDEDKQWWLRPGPLYPQLQDILIRGDLGLRIIRPKSLYPVKVHFETNEENFGGIVRTPLAETDTLRFDIYIGVDRSHTQDDYPVVAFNVQQGDILNAQYLFAVQDFKTSCEVMSGAGGSDQYRNSTEMLYTGWQRRVMSYDAGEPDLPDEPTEPPKNATNAENNQYDADMAEWRAEVDDIKAEFKADAEAEALRALKKTRRVSILSGDISSNTPHQYKQQYNLGDTVSLYGENGLTERMVVSEYVRTDDSDGDRGYPGLVKP